MRHEPSVSDGTCQAIVKSASDVLITARGPCVIGLAKEEAPRGRGFLTLQPFERAGTAWDYWRQVWGRYLLTTVVLALAWLTPLGSVTPEVGAT
jgi:hypothetical protein